MQDPNKINPIGRGIWFALFSHVRLRERAMTRATHDPSPLVRAAERRTVATLDASIAYIADRAIASIVGGV